MRKKSVKAQKDGLAFLVESAAALRNLTLKENTDVPGKRAWKLAAGSTIATEITSWGDDLLTCVATPIVMMPDYEIFLPSDIRIEADAGSVAEWITPAIVTSLERADALLEILSGIGDALKAAKYSGKVKSMSPSQKRNELHFPYMIAEYSNDSVFTTEITVCVHDDAFACKAKTRVMGRNGGLPIFEMEVARSPDATVVLDAVATAIELSRESYKKVVAKPPVSEAYKRLTSDPGAYGGKVVLLVPRVKSEKGRAPDK
jgi:hypothetical protein